MFNRHDAFNRGFRLRDVSGKFTTPYKEGREDWWNGASTVENPFTEPKAREEWERGWWDCENAFTDKLRQAIENAPVEACEDFQVSLERGDIPAIEAFVEKYY